MTMRFDVGTNLDWIEIITDGGGDVDEMSIEKVSKGDSVVEIHVDGREGLCGGVVLNREQVLHVITVLTNIYQSTEGD